ncbi:unnamed protein product [Acanthosepion pharaonis]|uniref:BTB domain-containing protein n=1 Tax=Acanthosepion pharaonis TaxID=158019 RepID=A0A812EV97_ACAPH|nr:unnamed protein product [Sepia pharaonis]
MTLRIPPMCPWASQFNDVNSSKNVHDFYSPKTLQIDNDLQEITSNAATNDFFTTIEAECLQPLEPNRSPAHENKPDISLSIEDKSNFSSTITNKNLNSLDFYGPSPLSSEFLLQSSMNNNDLHSTLFSSATENQINHELAQTEAEIRRRTFLMSEHYNRKTRREVQKDMLASSLCSQTFQMNSQAHPTDDFHQNLQIQAKKNLPTGDRNVAKTIRKAVDTPTHSYVIHKHQGSMLSNMADLWKKGKLCDATIGNGTMKIMVHKIVLVALSPQLLSLPNTDLTSGCFQLTFPQEIGGDALWAFAKYMYEGVVSLNVDVLEDMERISKILNLQDLQDMCSLYRNQVNLPNNTSLSQASIVNNSSTTDIAINLDPLQPSVTSAPTSSGVSFFSLPSGDITQTVSRPVQHLQILSTSSNDHQLPYSSNQSPTPGLKLSPEERSCVTISPSDSDSDYTIVTSNVKQEPSSPDGI